MFTVAADCKRIVQLASVDVRPEAQRMLVRGGRHDGHWSPSISRSSAIASSECPVSSFSNGWPSKPKIRCRSS